MSRALGVVVLPLLIGGTQDCGITVPPQTREQACLASYATWQVTGLAPEQVPETPDQLLKAQLRVGDSVGLQVSRINGTECGDLVKHVVWHSSESGVAAVTAEGALGARLDALSPGESALWADVYLQNLDVRRAELYAVPAGRSSRLRVYAVTVTADGRTPCDRGTHPGC
jgi:hypothetical protein